MATVQHSTLTTSDLHEPKGAASAVNHSVYKADGAGSGSWVRPDHGWGYYKDNASAQTFNTTAAKLSVDGAGSTTNTSYLPPSIRGSGNIWDTTNDKITPINVGDAYDLRIDLPVTARTGSPGEFKLELDIGGTSSPSIVIVERIITLAPTPPYSVSVAIPIFTLSTFLSNGGQLFLTADTGTVDVTAPAVFIAKVFDANW